LESLIKIKINKFIYKAKSEMGRIISTLILCYVAVTYYPLEGFRTENHCNHAAIENHTSGTASPGISRPEESGQYSVGAGDRSDTGNERPEASDGLP